MPLRKYCFIGIPYSVWGNFLSERSPTHLRTHTAQVIWSGLKGSPALCLEMPFLIILTAPTTVKVEDNKSWIHSSRIKWAHPMIAGKPALMSQAP